MYAKLALLILYNLQALFLESPLGPNIKVLELREAKLSSWAISRLAK
jgi:hypothetical protein